MVFDSKQVSSCQHAGIKKDGDFKKIADNQRQNDKNVQPLNNLADIDQTDRGQEGEC